MTHLNPKTRLRTAEQWKRVEVVGVVVDPTFVTPDEDTGVLSVDPSLPCPPVVPTFSPVAQMVLGEEK